jgi:hypothetical protein
VRVIQCPRCHHLNRPSVRAAICDRCGEDISLYVVPAIPAEPGPAQEPLTPVEPVAVPAASSASEVSGADLLGRGLLAIAAVSAGCYAGFQLETGSALSLDPYGAGSVAVLSAALGFSGLVLLLAGSGKGAQGVSVGLRLLGVVLAVVGTMAAVALVLQPAPPAGGVGTGQPMVVYPMAPIRAGSTAPSMGSGPPGAPGQPLPGPMPGQTVASPRPPGAPAATPRSGTGHR